MQEEPIMKQNHPIFRGIATALITPTTPTGIDYDRFGRLIDWQIQQGISPWSSAAPRGRAPP